MQKKIWVVIALLATVACGEDPTVTGGFTPHLSDKQLAQPAPSGDFGIQEFGLSVESCSTDCPALFNRYRGCASWLNSSDTYWCSGNQCNLRYTSGFSISCVLSAGQCLSNSNCGSGQVCENYQCVTANQEGWSCNDGNSCTDNDRYNWQGQCVGTPRTCNDGKSCTRDYCSAGSCVYEQNCGSGQMCNSWGSCEASLGYGNNSVTQRLRFEVRYVSWWRLNDIDVEGMFCSYEYSGQCHAANYDFWGPWDLWFTTYADSTNLKRTVLYLNVLPEAQNYYGYLDFTMPIVSDSGFNASNVFNTPGGGNGEGGTLRVYDDYTNQEKALYCRSGTGGGAICRVYMRR